MSRAKVIAKAVSQLGATEKPPYSNKTKFGLAYGWNGVPWCVIFVWWCFSQAGLPKAFYAGRKTASTEALYQWAKANGKWHTEGRRGDICLMNFGTPGRNVTHAGLVEKMTPAGPQNIEGNTSYGDNVNGGAVMRRVRSRSYVVGYVRPDYPKTAPEPRTARVNTRSDDLMLRARPSIWGRVLKSLPKGTTVTVVKRGRLWTKVSHRDMVGYCATRYLKFGG